MKRLCQLFWELFRISLFVIGGGYSILAIADHVFSRRGWLREDELIEQLPVFQMIPGLIATHTAVYVGNRVAGPLGSLVGVVAVALPSITVFSLVAACYARIPIYNPWLGSAFVGLRAALTGIIAATLIRSWRKFMTDAFAYALFLSGVTAIALLDVPIAAMLIASMIFGLLSTIPAGHTTFRASWLPLLLFLQYGSLCFGGGFVLVPMYLSDFVGPEAPYLQLPHAEFSNIMAVSQMTPGPIGVNCATFFGFRLAGIPGAAVASLLLLLPGSLMSWLVFRSLERFRNSRIVHGVMRGIRPASIALMSVALLAFARLSVLDSHGKFNTWGAIFVILTTIMTMKKKISVILIIALSAFATCILRADDISTEKYPDADVVIVEDREHVEYAPDGTSVSSNESWSRILTERGRREESTMNLGYNARYGTARILYVGVIGADGEEREIDVSGTTKEMTDNSSLSENIVDPLDRQIVCAIPGLKVGDTVHVRTERRTTKSRIKDQWCDMAVMEWQWPIIKSVYEVLAPRERPIRSRAILHPLGNITEEIKPQPDGSTLYVYTATNSPRVFPEPDMPPLWNEVQTVSLSTAASWKELSTWYWELSQPHLAKTTPAITNKVEELGRDLKAIFKFVSQEVRYMGLTMEDTAPGYAPHDVNITFDDRSGVCRDKAALLVAMLRIAGYEAYPVLINAGAKMNPAVPKPFFNHAIACVVSNGKYVLMDPTNENTKDLCPAYLCNCSYLVARPDGDELRTSEVPPPEGNLVGVRTHGKLSDDGTVILESHLDFTGINDTIYRGALAKATPEQRQKFFESRVKALQPGAQLIRCDILPEDLRDTSAPLQAHIVAKLPETVLRGETEDTFNLPFVSRPFAITGHLLGGNTSLAKRRYPLVIDTTARVREEVEIDIGTSLGDVRSLPPEVDISGGYAFRRSFRLKDGKLCATREHTVGDVEFDPAEYATLRESMKRVEAIERKLPIFSTDGAKGANVRWLDESMEVDIASDTEWTVTNTFVKEILSYRGMKDSAELQYSFNPTWKNVEVIEATVSNTDGRVMSVSPVAMNVMDCSWAAAAPRYPAGKTLIVNLPAVEIGSVISVTTASTITNAPAAYYGHIGFDARDPLARRHARVNDWQRTVTHPKRIPEEPNQPAGSLWRDVTIISRGSFAKVAPVLRLAADVKPLDWQGLPVDNSNSCRGVPPTLRDFRDWMAKNVRIAGPSLYEVPIPLQLTDPKTVIEERYATRLDYVRTLCAMLRGAGFDADIIFAAANAGNSDTERNRNKFEHPNVRAFGSALCRVRVTSGGFLGFGGETTTYYLGIENEYSPIETSAFNGCDFFDPADESFGVVKVPAPCCGQNGFDDRVESCARYTVAADGTVTMNRKVTIQGIGVGAFRKRYTEILPEDFSRHYQELLRAVSAAAQGVGDLRPDVRSYPASLSLDCVVPEFATVDGDTITVKLPSFDCPIPALVGTTRQTPIALAAEDGGTDEVTVRFPSGYTLAEHLPESFAFRDPHNPSLVLVRNDVSQRIEDGQLVVTVRRTVAQRREAIYGSEYAELFRDWNRIGTSQSSRTVVVRRGASK